MSYEQYTTLRKVKEELGIEHKSELLFPNRVKIAPTDFLVQYFERLKDDKVAYFSEKSRSEAIVFPILNEIRILNNRRFALYSGPILDADKDKGLNGECDYILSTGEQEQELDIPLFCTVEAKENDLKLGTAQCIAQMEGMRIFNERNKIEPAMLFGCVTTGEIWQFIRLENNVAYIDKHRYYLTDLTELLGGLQAVIDVVIPKI